MSRLDFYSLLIEKAKAEFPLAGALDLDLATEIFSAHFKKYDSWLDSGYAGTMGYLHRGKDRRANLRLLFPEAESILCVAEPYSTEPLGGKSGPKYARYLRGEDYHQRMKDGLDRVMKSVSQKWTSKSPLLWKTCVDTSAVLERSWASLAGLGWIGKNTLLIHPQYGSYLLLGEVLINQETGHGPVTLPNYCGNCTKCLDACPTKSFAQPGLLDSRKCISYLTLENRIQDKIEVRDSWVAGCDLCQEVCPFNFKRAKTEPRQHGHEQDDGFFSLGWKELTALSEEEYEDKVKNLALNRVKPKQFQRNLQAAKRSFLD